VAAYPTLTTTINSRVESLDGQIADRATNGALKVRSLYTADKLVFLLEHEISTASKATLDAFWAANKLLDITYTSPFDGASYTVRMRKPVYRRTPVHWFADVRLEEV
jgi:hypothetical protein